MAATIWTASGPVLSAAAAVWLVLGRGIFRQREQCNSGLGIGYQEQFEVTLFELPWNTALAGERPKVDNVVDDAARARHPDREQDWFVDTSPLGPPGDFLVAQLESALYGRRNHRAYARLLTRLAFGLFAVEIVIWLVSGLSFTDYLIRLAFPSLPALQDFVFLADEHRKTAAAKENLESQLYELLTRLESGGAVTMAECRAVQDAVYDVRRVSPSMPTWFFRQRRNHDATAIRAAIADWSTRLTSS